MIAPRIVGRSVVDDDHLDRGPVQRQRAVDGGAHERGVVPVGDHHREAQRIRDHGRCADRRGAARGARRDRGEEARPASEGPRRARPQCRKEGHRPGRQQDRHARGGAQAAGQKAANHQQHRRHRRGRQQRRPRARQLLDDPDSGRAIEPANHHRGGRQLSQHPDRRSPPPATAPASSAAGKQSASTTTSSTPRPTSGSRGRPIAVNIGVVNSRGRLNDRQQRQRGHQRVDGVPARAEQQLDDLGRQQRDADEARIEQQAGELDRGAIGAPTPLGIRLQPRQHRQRHLGDRGGGDGPQHVDGPERHVQVTGAFVAQPHAGQDREQPLDREGQEQRAHGVDAESQQRAAAPPSESAGGAGGRRSSTAPSSR